MAIGSTLAGVARVAVEVDTGTSEQNLAAFDRRFTQTTGAMNEGAIRVELASRRLQRTLAQYPADSDKALRATLALKAAQRSAAAETSTLARKTHESAGSFRTFAHDVERGGLGLAAGTRAVKGLRSALLFGGVGFASGFGISTFLRSARDAAIGQQVALGQLQAALHAAGIEQSAYTGTVKEAIDANEQLGFSEKDSAQSLSLAVRATKSVEGAQRLQAIAADVARGRNMNLVAATQLLVRVQAGQVGSLRRLGIEVDKGISGAKALDAVQRQYAGAAATYGDSAAGAQDRLNIAVHKTEETIGTALLPTITSLNGKLATWLDNSRNQERIQHDVNAAVSTGEKIAHDLGNAWKFVGPPIRLANRLLGGTAHSIELLGGALALLKLRSFATDMGLLRTRTAEAGAAAAVSAGEFDALAASEGRAAGAGRGVGRGGLGRVGGALAIGVAADLTWQGGQALSKQLGRLGIPNVGDTPRPPGVSFNDLVTLKKHLDSGATLTEKDKQVLRAYGQTVPDFSLSATKGLGPHGASAVAAAANTPTPKRRTSLAGMYNIASLHLAQAGLTPGTADDVKALDDQASILRRQIAREKNLAKKTDLISQLQGVLSQLQSIQDAKDQQAADKARTAKEKRAKALEAALKRKRAREKALDAKIKRLYAEDIAGSTSNANQALKDRSEYLNKKYGLGRSTSTGMKTAAAKAVKEAYLSARSNLDQQQAFLYKLGYTDSGALSPSAYRSYAEKYAKHPITQEQFNAGLREFLTAMQSLKDSASNVTPGPNVTVNQSFPHPPTPDMHREAIFAKHAMAAAFDG